MTDVILLKLTGASASILSVFATSSTFFAMSDALAEKLISNVTSVILGILTTVAATVTAVLAFKAQKMARESKVAAEQAKDVSLETHKIVNGSTETWKVMAEKYFKSVGVTEGKAAEKAEQAIVAIATAAGVTQAQAEQKLPSVPVAIPVEGIKTLPP